MKYGVEPQDVRSKAQLGLAIVLLGDAVQIRGIFREDRVPVDR